MPSSEKILKKYLQLLGTLILISGAAFFVASRSSNYFDFELLPGKINIFQKERMRSFFDKLPQLNPDSEKWAFFWGASEIESGLETTILDELFTERNLQFKAYNLGIRGVYPLVYQAFTTRLQEELDKQHKKIAVSFFKIPLNKLTVAYSLFNDENSLVDNFSILLTPGNYSFLKEHPSLFAKSLLDHYLLADMSLDTPYYLVYYSLRDHLGVFHRDPGYHDFFMIWLDKDLMEKDFWSLSAAGSYRWNLPKTKDLFESYLKRKKDPTVIADSYLQFEDCCGMKNLDLNENLLGELIQQIKTLKTISNKVVIYNIPEEPSFQSFKGSRYNQNVQKIAERIKSETGLDVYNAEVSLEDSDYIDFLHLSLTGQRKFYSALLKKVYPQ
jgi:hypothetical protein